MQNFYFLSAYAHFLKETSFTHEWSGCACHLADKGGIGTFHELEVLEFLFKDGGGSLTGGQGHVKSYLIVAVVMGRHSTVAVLDLLCQTLLEA